MTTLNLRVEGAGPPVLLLHAGVADLRMWDHQAAALVAAGRTVLRCDLRGYGGTPLAPGASYSDAEDVVALLDEQGVDGFALVGASYGGWVAQQVAAGMPGRVERLVLLSPLAEVVEPDEQLRAFGQAENEHLDADDVEGATALNVRTFLGPEADEAAAALLHRMQRDAFELQLAAGDVENRELPVDPTRLDVPTTVVTGARDLGFFTATGRELVRQMPRATLVELSWAAHLPSLERPAETSRLVVDALAEVAP